MQFLICWLGNADLRASVAAAPGDVGPIASALKALNFDELHLISDHPHQDARAYMDWLSAAGGTRIQLHETRLSSPTHYEEIYRAADAVLASLGNGEKNQLSFHLSPGTPAMAAVWIILAKTRYPAQLIESSREQGVRVVSFPFDIAAEYLPGPSALADADWQRLTQGLPEAAPEFDRIVHRCEPMRKLLAKARLLAQRSVPVLIQGESGTGKELFARAMHKGSPHANGPFVAVNCGAIPQELIDAELFGHEKGAFTGAATARIGYFEAADGGTLFLDEIGELPLASQVRLLRVLQEGEVTRLGSNQPRLIYIRVIAATNRVLAQDAAQGRFREDLYYRLVVGVLTLPPLRERQGDVSLLIETFLSKLHQEVGADNKDISVGAKNLLLQHTWPGNVRELSNTLLRASIWATGREISAEDVREALAVNLVREPDGLLGRPLGNGFLLQDVMAEAARHYLNRALGEAHGNKTEAARLLGLSSYQTLSNWMEKYGVDDVGTAVAHSLT
ncbi:MAG: sigma 54-interacting transcriptional regulator [Anaerolineales bacterium]|nr:sigma 54-interacting transcriptional regulator [Anaerolineales bacterium]